MRAMDVMTTPVITVEPETTVQDLAKLLSEKGISGVPVFEGGDRLVGIVSEGDLLHRAETGTERRAAKTPVMVAQLARRRGGSRSRLCQGAWPKGQRHHEPRGDHGRRHDRSRRGRDAARNQADQAGAGGPRRQARRHHQPGQSGPRPGDDQQRAGDRRRRRRPHASARGCCRSCAASAGPMSGRPTSWSATRSCMSGCPTTSPRRSARRLRVAAENIPGVRRVEEHIVPAPVIPAF